MRLEVTQDVRAPRHVVWGVLTDWEAQAAWMVDARSVEVLTPHRVGAGVTIRVPTVLLGVTVHDVMRVTAWREPELLEVVHLGRVIRGRGAFVLDELGAESTRVTWWEQVDPPLGALGEVGARLVVAPLTRWLFGRSLRALAATAQRA